MSVSRETTTRLNIFAELLLHWTKRINLIGPKDRPHVWNRHIEDSLQLADLLPPNLDRAIDLGSGGGFPGLILAIATGVHFDLIESDQRKAAFLREAIRATDASAAVHAQRIETYRAEPVRAITSRALAPLPRLLTMAQPFLTREGHLLLLKGEDVATELTAAAKQWQMTVEQLPSRTDSRATILDITGLDRIGTKS